MKKVLFVDDDEDVLEAVDFFLSKHDYIVKTVINANDTIKEVKSFNPDVIFLDVKLGRIDGRYLCQKLKSDTGIKHIPIILFSAMTGIDKTYLNCNANDFLQKPFDVFDLITLINKHTG